MSTLANPRRAADSRAQAGVNTIRPGRSRMASIDPPLVLAVAALLMLGVLMVYSASIALADGPRYANYGRYYFIERHVQFLLLGVLAAGVVLACPMRLWQRCAPTVFVAALALLVAVLIPGIGREVNGAARWLPLGPVNLQPSELMKFAVVLFTALYTVRKQDHMHDFKHGFLPMLCVVGSVGSLLALEPDLGGLIVIAVIAVAMLFIGGLSFTLFAGLAGTLAAAAAALIWFAPWRWARFIAYLDPWKAENAYGSAYQLSHSLIALGRGQWLGVGLGASVEKLHYLPEAHTDFILAVIGEELGFVGVAAVIVLFAVLVQRGFEIGRQAIIMERAFSGLAAQGVAVWLGAQALIHMGVCLGALPTKGLTLPLVSYGGSGLLMNLCALGLLARVDLENRRLMRAGRQP